jgi:hypothetical protein
MPGVDLRTRDCGGHAVVELRGELGLTGVAVALAAVAVREPDIIADLAALEFIDSSCGADPGRVGISDAVIRSFERLGWATKAWWPVPAQLGSCRSGSRQPDGIR